jgi:hypothetical protein
MTQYNTVLASARSFLKGGTNFHAQMAEHVNRKGHVPAELINKLAREWEKQYTDSVATLTDTGWRFKYADGARHGAAQQKWDREVRAYDATPKSAQGGSNKSAQQDAVSKLVAAYGRLSAAERRRFLKSI